MYQFRILNASNARFFNIDLQGGPSFFQIAWDGGLSDKPVEMNRLLVLPAERMDVLVDFSQFAGKTLVLGNDPLAPDVSSPAPRLSSVLQFRVGTKVTTRGPRTVPATLPGTMPALGSTGAALLNPREVTLEEVAAPVTDEPLYGSLNGLKFMDQSTIDTVKLGSTEDWRLLNTTEDSHPIHLHLVQFQILDRTPFDAAAYKAALDASRQSGGPRPKVDQFVTGAPAAPDANERGWKDTVGANPGQITRLRTKWTLPSCLAPPQKYVYHCHILEHEDNSMMRPLDLVA